MAAPDKLRSPSAKSSELGILTIEGKVVVAGDMGTGKTSLVACFARGELSPATKPTVGVAFSKKTVSLPGVTVQFAIWDSAGQERFASINQMYFRGAGAAVLVFDMTSNASFERLDFWLDQVRSNGVPGMVVAIAANKADMRAVRAVTSEAARAYAEQRGCLYFETSAKNGAGVTDLFTAIGACRPSGWTTGSPERRGVGGCPLPLVCPYACRRTFYHLASPFPPCSSRGAEANRCWS
jgi:Ras-related protein Rab-5C